MNSEWSTTEDEVKLVVKLLKKHSINEGSKVLEVGCSNGRITINLTRVSLFPYLITKLLGDCA